MLSSLLAAQRAVADATLHAEPAGQDRTTLANSGPHFQLKKALVLENDWHCERCLLIAICCVPSP